MCEVLHFLASWYQSFGLVVSTQAKQQPQQLYTYSDEATKMGKLTWFEVLALFEKTTIFNLSYGISKPRIQ